MREVSATGLQDLIRAEKKLILLDARAYEYFAWEHLPKARNLRWKYVPDRAAEILPDNRAPIVTYCQSFLCPASSNAYASLEKLGYSNLWEYSGGIEDWRAHGFRLGTVAELKLAPFLLRFPASQTGKRSTHAYLLDLPENLLIVNGPQTLTEENEDFIRSFNKPVAVYRTPGAPPGDSGKLRELLGATFLSKSELKRLLPPSGDARRNVLQTLLETDEVRV